MAGGCIKCNLHLQVVPSEDLEEADSEEAPSPSLLNDELRQEMQARQAKMHRYPVHISAPSPDQATVTLQCRCSCAIHYSGREA